MNEYMSWGRRKFLALATVLLVGTTIGLSSLPAAELPESALIDRIKKAGVLKAGVAIALPFVGQDPKTNEFFGTGVDIANWMATELGVKLEIIPQDWHVVVAAIQADQIDVAVAGLFATPERLKVVNMTNYLNFGICYAALKSNNKVNTLEDLNKPDVVFIQHEGGGTYQITSKKYDKATHKARLPAPGEQVPWAEMLSGEADVVPFDPPLVQAVNKEMPQVKVIPADCGMENSDLPSPVAFAYRKDDPGFQQYAEDFVKRHTDDLKASLLKYSAPEYVSLGAGQ